MLGIEAEVRVTKAKDAARLRQQVGSAPSKKRGEIMFQNDGTFPSHHRLCIESAANLPRPYFGSPVTISVQMCARKLSSGRKNVQIRFPAQTPCRLPVTRLLALVLVPRAQQPSLRGVLSCRPRHSRQRCDQ